MTKENDIVFCKTKILRDFLERFVSRNEIYTHKGLLNDLEFHVIYPQHRMIVSRESLDSYVIFYTTSGGGYGDAYKGIYYAKLIILDDERVNVCVFFKKYLKVLNILSLALIAFMIVYLLLKDDFAYLILIFLLTIGLIMNRIYKRKFQNNIIEFLNMFK